MKSVIKYLAAIVFTLAAVCVCDGSKYIDPLCDQPDSVICKSPSVALKCNKLQLCMNMVEKRIRQDREPVCSACKKFANDVQYYVTHNKQFWEKAKMYIKDYVCNAMLYRLESLCDAIVENYIEEILLAMTDDFDLHCEFFWLCDNYTNVEDPLSKPEKQQYSMQKSPLNDDQICGDCLTFFKTIEILLANTSFQADITQYVQVVCIETYVILPEITQLCYNVTRDYCSKLLDVTSRVPLEQACHRIFCDTSENNALDKLSSSSSSSSSTSRSSSGASTTTMTSTNNNDNKKIKFTFRINSGYDEMLERYQKLNRSTSREKNSSGGLLNGLMRSFIQSNAGSEGSTSPLGDAGGLLNGLMRSFIQTNKGSEGSTSPIGDAGGLLNGLMRSFIQTNTGSESSTSPLGDAGGLLNGLMRSFGQSNAGTKGSSSFFNSVSCDACQGMIKLFFTSTIDNPAGEHNISNIFKYGCYLMSSSDNSRTQCNKMIDVYGPTAIKMMLSIVDPNTICKMLGMCDGNVVRTQPAAGAEAKTAGDKLCSEGPSYWCRNMETAKQCGAVEYCTSNKNPLDNLLNYFLQ